MGLPKQNIITWSKNGIEYFYPREILQSIFQSNDQPNIKGDTGELNGIQYSKNELVEKVVGRMDKTTNYPEEFEEKLLKKIDIILV
ncbi:MAG: hypothetical protein DSY46_05785 [Hydrogenimonas sp.]|nr:MAG: hypothetical protein DSY46_05785 [Hydrogenimonas sp.]